MEETWVQSLRGEDPLEKEIATHSPTLVFLPGKSQGQRSLAGYSPWGHKSQTRLRTTTYAYTMSTTDTKFTSNKAALLLPPQTHTLKPTTYETHIHNTYNVHRFTAQTHNKTDPQSIHTRSDVLRMMLFLAVKSIWYHTDLLNPALLIHPSPGPPNMPQYVLAKLLTLQCDCLRCETAGLTPVNNSTHNTDKQNPCLAPPMRVQYLVELQH